MSLIHRRHSNHLLSRRRLLFCLLLLTAPVLIFAGMTRTAAVRRTEAPKVYGPGNGPAMNQSQCVPPPAGMLAWYPGDGHNNDIQAGNNGVTNGSVPFGPGEVGQAFQFNGATGNAISAPEQPAYQVTSLTIDAWIKIAAFPTTAQGAGMIYFRGDNRPDLDPYFLFTAPGNRVGFHIGADNGTRVDILATAPANQWIHVAGTFDDPTNTMRLYIDGAQVAQQSTAIVPMTVMPAANNPGVSIGNIHVSPFSVAFNGLIDEVELFGRALTPTEIQSLYSAGANGKCKPDADADGVTDALDACPDTPSGTTVNAAGCPAGECLAPPADMVGWYPGDGNNNEIVGANYGTTNGTVNFAAGEVGQAFQFNGAAGNAVSASELLAYQVTSFSVDAWVKIAGFPSPAQGSGMIFFRGDSRPALDPYFLYSAPNGKVGFHIESASGAVVQIEANAPANQWVHVTGTFDDASNTIRLYVNGVLVAQQITAVVPMTNMIGANPGVGIGNIHVAPFSQPFNGLIDEVALFARALTSAEVQGLYLAGAAGKCQLDADSDGVLDHLDACPGTPLGTSVNTAGCVPGQCFTPPDGMVAWYSGDGTTNDILGGHNPSATNAVSFVAGTVGQGFDFGAGGYIDVPSSPDLDNQQFTVDAWARPDGPGPNNDGAGSVIVQKNINVLGGVQTSLQLVWRGTDHRFLFNAYNVQVATASSFQQGQFYHVAGTYDGRSARIYVNGVLQGEAKQATTIVYDNSVPYTIGSNFSGFRNLGFSRTWDGVIDEVEIFNHALTIAEINAIYSAGSAGKCRPDADGDGVANEVDNCPLDANSDQANNDGDAQGDACDSDDDNDGVADSTDNCPLMANTDQADNDGDAQGDVCDPDDDNDGVADATDNCALSSNADQSNNDGDSLGDACDTDDDNDGTPDTTDNCPLTANPDQANTDGDAQGDVCDPDDDNDGVADTLDQCPGTPAGVQVNVAGCPDADGDGITDAADNCPAIANDDQANHDGDPQGDACDPDDDGDGYSDDSENTAGSDPLNPASTPEVCDGLDNDLNEGVDEGFANTDGDSQADCVDADDDGDSYSDAAETTAGSDPLNANSTPEVCDGTDNDLNEGIDEGFVNTDGDSQADCVDPDDDNDGQSDADETACGSDPLNAGSMAPNTDGDGQPDCVDPDDDGDGVNDGADNCPLIANASQTDTDGDGQGDACDPDDDGDGVSDAADNCPLVSNSSQTDTDGDGQGDACDGDDDNDGVADTTDNCSLTPNPDQADNDGDSLGNTCDPDDDNDGVIDAMDNCPTTANPDQADSDGDGIGNACEGSGPLYNICVLYDQEKAHKAGSTIPIKLRLCDAAGNNLSSPGTLVMAIGIMRTSANAFGPVEDSGNANPDYNFRYDATLGGPGGGYIFNLSTKGLTTGTYLMGFRAGSDPTTYTVQFKVK